MKLGVVGTGMIAKIIVPHLGEWGCPVTAVCGTPATVDEARALADPYDAAVFGVFEDMLAQADIDTVYIAVPNALHGDFALKALEAGKHVIVEKPFAANEAQVRRIACEARSRDLMVYEAVSTLYLPNFARLKALLPRIGQVKIVSMNYSQYSSRYDAFRAGTVLPAFDPAQAGGALMDLGLYNIQYIVGLFGSPVRVDYEANVERGIDTSGVATLDYGSFKAVSICAKDCAAPVQNVIQGNDGYLLQTTPANKCGEVLLHLNDGTEERYQENPDLQWESEFRAFARAIDAGDREDCYRMLDHSIAVAHVMNEARRAAGVRFPMDEA